MSKTAFFAISFVLLSYTMLFLLIFRHGLMMDEHLHYSQIQRFLHKDFSLSPELAMPPGYHMIIACVSYIVGFSDIPYYPATQFIRGVTWVLSLSTFSFFYACAKSINTKMLWWRFLLFGVLPVTAPFFPLVYTDICSLSLILCAYWLMMKRRYVGAALVSVASIWVRHNNIIWSVFFVADWYRRTYGWSLSTDSIKQSFKSQWPLLFPVLSFLSIVWWFQGMSVGSGTDLRTGIFIPQNLYVLLFLFFVFFLPDIIVDAKLLYYHAVSMRLKALGIFCLFPVFWYSFSIRHPYNFGTFFIHNAILEYATSSWIFSVVFFVCILISCLYIYVHMSSQREEYILYGTVVLFFLPLVIVEQRYTIVPFTLYILSMRIQEKFRYSMLISWNMMLTSIIFWGIWSWRWFW